MVDFPYSVVNLSAPFGASDSAMQISSEFSESNATPEKNGGTRITRHQMNGLGYLATIGLYLEQIGYPCLYQEGVTYPKDAIVTKIEEVNGRTYAMEFRNTIDGNGLRPPSIAEGIDLYHSRANAKGYADTYWEPLYDFPYYNFFPDYSNRKLLFSKNIAIGSEDVTYKETIPLTESGWLYIVRTYDAWDNYPNYTELENVELRYPQGKNENIYMDSIRPYEGPIATRLLPPPPGSLIISGKSGNGMFYNTTTKSYETISGNLKLEVYLFPLGDWE